MTLADFIVDLSSRLEEVPGASVFWSETYEMLPALVDSMFEAALITGTVQAVNVPVNLPANQTYMPLQPTFAIGDGYGEGGYGDGGYGGSGFSDYGVPDGVIAALRLKAPYPIRKTTLKGMDDTFPNWENAAPGSQLVAWGPLGVSSFFVYPQLASPVTVMMDFLVSPVNVPRPYTTAINVPFLTEFTDLLPMGAAVMLRAKELGAEVEEAAQVLNDYMGQLKGLSLYQNRLDSLVLTTAYGAKAGVQTQKREVV